MTGPIQKMLEQIHREMVEALPIPPVPEVGLGSRASQDGTDRYGPWTLDNLYCLLTLSPAHRPTQPVRIMKEAPGGPLRIMSRGETYTGIPFDIVLHEYPPAEFKGRWRDVTYVSPAPPVRILNVITPMEVSERLRACPALLELVPRQDPDNVITALKCPAHLKSEPQEGKEHALSS